MKNAVNKTKRRKRAARYAVLLLLVSLSASVILCFMFDDAFALTAKEESVTVIFKEPTGMWKTSAVLKENGLVRSRVWFCLYSSARGNRFTAEAGSYTLNRAGGFDHLAEKLSSGG